MMQSVNPLKERNSTSLVNRLKDINLKSRFSHTSEQLQSIAHRNLIGNSMHATANVILPAKSKAIDAHKLKINIDEVKAAAMACSMPLQNHSERIATTSKLSKERDAITNSDTNHMFSRR